MTSKYRGLENKIKGKMAYDRKMKSIANCFFLNSSPLIIYSPDKTIVEQNKAAVAAFGRPDAVRLSDIHNGHYAKVKKAFDMAVDTKEAILADETINGYRYSRYLPVIKNGSVINIIESLIV